VKSSIFSSGSVGSAAFADQLNAIRDAVSTAQMMALMGRLPGKGGKENAAMEG
jgi:hypothetical protein